MATSNITILKINASDWRELCTYLNLYGCWYDLGTRLGIDLLTLIQIQNNRGKNNGAEDLLIKWASMNGTVTELFIQLAKMEFQIGMNILKKYVDEKYHKLLRLPKDFDNLSLAIDHNIETRNLEENASAFKTSDFDIENKGAYKIYSKNISDFPSLTKNSLSRNKFSNFDNRKLSPQGKSFANISSKLNNLNDAVQATTTQKLNVSPKKKDCSPEKEDVLGGILSISFDSIKEATSNFNKDNIIGQGGFGIVYKGKWKGNLVAIKCLKPRLGKKNAKFDISHQQMLNELKILKKARIDNILNLYAVCLEKESPCLIYQYMVNGSLEDRLLCKNNTVPLNWVQRSNIMEGTAKGLNYLHTLPGRPEVHGDIKSANILLDANFEAKIGDFGLSREGPSGGYTHCKITSINGTQVYLPPEYLRDHQLSAKVDVYSYGTVLLEVTTGQRAYSEKRYPPLLVEYVGDFIRTNSMVSLRDQKAGIENMAWFAELLHMGIDCTRIKKKERPDMSQIMIVFDELRRRTNTVEKVRSKEVPPENIALETTANIQSIKDMNTHKSEKLSQPDSNLNIHEENESPQTLSIHPSQIKNPPISSTSYNVSTPEKVSLESLKEESSIDLPESAAPYTVPFITALGLGGRGSDDSVSSQNNILDEMLNRSFLIRSSADHQPEFI